MLTRGEQSVNTPGDSMFDSVPAPLLTLTYGAPDRRPARRMLNRTDMYYLFGALASCILIDFVAARIMHVDFVLLSLQLLGIASGQVSVFGIALLILCRKRELANATIRPGLIICTGFIGHLLTSVIAGLVYKYVSLGTANDIAETITIAIFCAVPIISAMLLKPTIPE